MARALCRVLRRLRVPAANANNAIEAISARLPILSPEEDEALLREAGFGGVELFYAGFTFKGWVAC